MPRIVIDGVEVECRAGIPVLQAALEAGLAVPHYCYHPGLSVVASCRLCLMEMKTPNPKTGELVWSPKLAPSCQTPVRDGLEVRFDSEAVRVSRERCMEFFLLNHPLDCPVCDQAGECYLQDYSLAFGRSTSRMVDQKQVNPKKDIGPRTLLYQDRCVLCSRCVRFTDEISGTGELGIVNRGSRCEIDVFPGRPLDNPLQGNVVDVCPVGSLLDKDFLFKQRVWHLKRTDSICPGCSTGCAIHVDHNEDRVYRLRPRYNPGVNDWWMCDEGRFGWQYVYAPQRFARPMIRRGATVEPIDWESLPAVLRLRLAETVAKPDANQVVLMLSPFLACEEAWLLIRFVRSVAPAAILVLGPVPTVEQDRSFPVGAPEGAVRFVIRRERCPNRRGIERLIARAGGPAMSSDDFAARAAQGEFAAVYVAGGYPHPWVSKEMAAAVEKVGFVVLHDLLPSDLQKAADLVIPAGAFVEREGCFLNEAGRLQPFQWAVAPPEGGKRDGQFLYELAGMTGLYTGARVRKLMAEEMPEFAEVHAPPPMPKHAH